MMSKEHPPLQKIEVDEATSEWGSMVCDLPLHTIDCLCCSKYINLVLFSDIGVIVRE